MPPPRSYEHTNAICNVLNGVPAPKLTTALEEKLKAMFAEIQEPFERNCPPQRKNFLSYGYTLYKMCELLGEDELLRCVARVPREKTDRPGTAMAEAGRSDC